MQSQTRAFAIRYKTTFYFFKDQNTFISTLFIKWRVGFIYCVELILNVKKYIESLNYPCLHRNAGLIPKKLFADSGKSKTKSLEFLNVCNTFLLWDNKPSNRAPSYWLFCHFSTWRLPPNTDVFRPTYCSDFLCEIERKVKSKNAFWHEIPLNPGRY